MSQFSALSLSQLSPARSSPASGALSSSTSSMPLSRPHLDRIHRRAMGAVRSLKRQLPKATSEKELAHIASLETVVGQFHQALQRALEDRRQIHSDALELANAESMDLYNSVLAAERRATVAEQNLNETQAKLEEQRKLMSSRFANELNELKNGWSDQLAATARQNEMRTTLDKTRKVAEESAMRVKVMADERSRMIADQTALRRQVEDAAEKLRKTVENLNKSHVLALKEKDKSITRLNGRIARLEADTARALERVSTAESARNEAERKRAEAERKQVEAEKKVTEMRSVDRTLRECQSDLAAARSDLRQSESARANLEQKEAALRLDVDRLVDKARQEAIAAESLTVGRNSNEQKAYEALSEDRERLREVTRTLEGQVAKANAELTAAGVEKGLLQTRCKDVELARDRLSGVVENLQKDLAAKKLDLSNEIQRAQSLEERMRQELEKAAAIHSLSMAKAIAVTQKEADERRTAAVAVVQERADALSEKINEQRHEIDDKNRALATEQATATSLDSRLKDALSEVEENRRALLDTLKLSSDVQNSETEVRSQLSREQEDHGRSKVELETLRVQLSRALADAEGAKKVCEELEVGRVRTREKREAAESRTRELESELGIARGRVLELEELRVQFEAEFRSLRGELESEKSQVQAEKENQRRGERDLEFAAEKRQMEIERHEMQLKETQRRCAEAEAGMKRAANEMHEMKTFLGQHESLAEDMNVKLALLQSERDSISEELKTQKVNHDAVIDRARELERSEGNSRNEITRIQAEVERLRLKCAQAEERHKVQLRRVQDSIDMAKKEKNNTMKAEEALARTTQENVLLRRRNMLMVNERDRVRRESEKLQSAARQAARKAQLAALHIQQMSVGQNSRADDAFSAAQDLNWVAIGGGERSSAV